MGVSPRGVSLGSGSAGSVVGVLGSMEGTEGLLAGEVVAATEMDVSLGLMMGGAAGNVTDVLEGMEGTGCLLASKARTVETAPVLRPSTPEPVLVGMCAPHVVASSQ